jgi:modulator of FtsH protease HflK
MADSAHTPDELRTPETPLDPGSQALSEALRSSFSVIKFVMLALVLVFLGSGVFVVGPQEQAMKIRLGRPVGEGQKALLGPGLYFSWPYPIDEHIKVPITSIQTLRSTIGWFATTPAMEAAGQEPQAPPGTPLNPLVDGSVLTADDNIIHSRVTLTYHISDPISYIFNFENASNAVQNDLDNALLEATGEFNVDDILRRRVIEFKEAIKQRVSQLVTEQHLGIEVEECQVESRPPRQVQDAFDNVLRAEENRSKVLNDARSYENQVSSRASADADSLVNAAQSDRVRLVNDVSSQAKRFNEVLPKFLLNPSLFAQQRLYETMGRVLTNAQEKIYLTQAGKEKELRLLLNREPPKKPQAPGGANGTLAP